MRLGLQDNTQFSELFFEFYDGTPISAKSGDVDDFPLSVDYHCRRAVTKDGVTIVRHIPATRMIFFDGLNWFF